MREIDKYQPSSTTIKDCRLLQLKCIHNRAGNITPVENNIDIPFEVKRIYYLYDIPGGASRAAHAHIGLEQIIIAASGSFDITLNDSIDQITHQLNRSYFALHIKPGIWRDISNFSSGAICLVLASQIYNENDYIRNFEDFKNHKQFEKYSPSIGSQL